MSRFSFLLSLLCTGNTTLLFYFAECAMAYIDTFRPAKQLFFVLQEILLSLDRLVPIYCNELIEQKQFISGKQK
ncbi:hypothetical protein BX667DRAFT_330886 [Coemansia mojavensis]|nr:hypothetical protein BX667DRAFT_330886 [Coemansia mojavensis]